MQKISNYLYSNRILVLADLVSYPVEMQIVYQRTVKIYKNIDNVIELDVKNADQKRINPTGTLKFIITDLNNALIADLSATASAVTGLYSVTIDESTTLNLDKGFYNFGLYVEATNGNKTLLYGDTQWGAKGRLELVGDIMPEPRPVAAVDTFNLLDSVYYGSAMNAEPGINGDQALHTFAFYPNGLQGTIYIDASLSESSQNVQWVEIDNIPSTSSTELFYKNYSGVYSWFRIRYTSSSGTLDKVLLRN
jgi:hypothetical protein